jgi:cytochrome P450
MFVPFWEKLDYKMAEKYRKNVVQMIEVFRKEYMKHYENYEEGVCLDFCDALIGARKQALKEGNKWAPYLTDANLARVIHNLVFTGIDTTQNTLRWLLLYVGYYPDIQKRLKQEIELEIGDRMATHEDKSRCHYAMAFIAETLRIRTVFPFGVPHESTVETQIGI